MRSIARSEIVGFSINGRNGASSRSLAQITARYSTANKEAMYDIPWAKTDFDKIKEQMQWVKGVPEVPGGYYTQRYILQTKT